MHASSAGRGRRRAWTRVGEQRSSARAGRGEFRRRYELRRPLYDEVADARARDVDGAVLAAAGVHVEVGALERLGELVPGTGPVALVSEPVVAGIYGADAQLALGDRLAEVARVADGRTCQDRAGSRTTLARAENWQKRHASGTRGRRPNGRCRLRFCDVRAGCPCLYMASSLVGQVDAAIGGKTGIDLPEGKNLVGAFHWPVRTVLDPALLETLPASERLNGMAEVVKTGLLAGEPLWELPDAELVRRCAAFKSALCLRDPRDEGPRHVLNLGHTFGHALEAAAGYSLPHGRRSRWACWPRCVSPGVRRTSSSTCSIPSRRTSIASTRGRPCSATRRGRCA